MPGRARYAVLFALPTDRAAFDAVVDGRMLQDYRRLLLRPGESPDAVWHRRYARVAAAAQELTAAARELDATIVARATLDDVRSSSASAQVLIIVGHWRGWTVSDSDLRATADQIRRRLSAGGLDFVGGFDAGASRGELMRSINDAIESGEVLTRTNPDVAAMVTSPAVQAALGRDVIDELLGDAIAPGNRVELCDGLHTPDALEAALHPRFAGELEFATCSSIVLATLIGRRRRKRVRVAHTLDLVDPLTCLIAITATFRYLKAEGGTYRNARLAVEAQLTEVRRQLKAEKRDDKR